MNFKEAIEFKNSIKEPIFLQPNVEMSIWVVPANDKDYEEYIEKCRAYLELNTLTDEFAIKYSSNLKFKVYGLWTNGTNVYKKVLHN